MKYIAAQGDNEDAAFYWQPAIFDPAVFVVVRIGAVAHFDGWTAPRLTRSLGTGGVRAERLVR